MEIRTRGILLENGKEGQKGVEKTERKILSVPTTRTQKVFSRFENTRTSHAVGKAELNGEKKIGEKNEVAKVYNRTIQATYTPTFYYGLKYYG